MCPERTKRCLAGGPGFEPRLTESESAVLPLNYPHPMELPELWPIALFALAAIMIAVWFYRETLD